MTSTIRQPCKERTMETVVTGACGEKRWIEGLQRSFKKSLDKRERKYWVVDWPWGSKRKGRGGLQG